MAVSDEKYQQVLDVSSASAQACAAAQMACQRAVEEITGYVKELRAWEKRPRQVLKEIIREVQGEAIPAAPVPNLPAVIEQVPVDLTPVTDAIDAHASRVAAIEAAVAELQRKQGRLVPLPSVSESRFAELEAKVNALATAPAPKPHYDIVSNFDASILDRIAALEELVVEGMQAPKVLAEHLKLTAELMEAMQTRMEALREVDRAALEQQRQIAEQAAAAQGGLGAVVQSIRSDLDVMIANVAQLRNSQASRDDVRARIISRGR